MADCLFCKIIAKEVPGRIVHEDDDVVAFEDIDPQAPTHVLVVPREHIPTLNDVGPQHDALIGKVHRVAAKIAKDRGHDGPGWRALWNVNRDALQSVFHIHLHVLGGRKFGWPPG